MPKNFSEYVQEITDARLEIQSLQEQLYGKNETLKLYKSNLGTAQQNNLPTEALLMEIDSVQAHVVQLDDDLSRAYTVETDLVIDFRRVFPPTYTDLISNLDDKIPVLFFPIRIETVFKKFPPAPHTFNNIYELWVRIFPDDIAVQTHEDALTDNEQTEGRRYFEALAAEDSAVVKANAWDTLCRSFSNERAAWIVSKMTPTNYPFAYPAPGVPFPAGNIVFPVLTPKAESWTKQPEIRILPDAFMINCYRPNGSSFSTQGNNIPDVVKFGMDPSSNTGGFDNSTGGLVADSSVDWMLDFDAAISKGLGAKITIQEADYDNGFSRILVCGVKYSLTPQASQDRLERLWDSHHYTDGFSLLKQGTSTNNTETDDSGYSMKDYGNTITGATEIGAPLFTETPILEYKTDGQLFCEALGIEYDPLKHIHHSNSYDIRDSMYMNTILYQSTWGNYVNNLLYPNVSLDAADQLRAFFNDYIRSRGALPSIRTGVQPYGLLPATVHSRMDWANDPTEGINRNIWEVVSSLHGHWEEAVSYQAALPGGVPLHFRGTSSETSSQSQRLMNIFTQNAMATEYVQRIAMGPGYIWNSLVYAEGSGYAGNKEAWLDTQRAAMDKIRTETGLPLSSNPRIIQNSVTEEHSSVSIPMVADNVHPDSSLPLIEGSEHNYLSMLSVAHYPALRDDDYSYFIEQENQGGGGIEIGGEEIPSDPSDPSANGSVMLGIDTMLFRLSKQSMLLEYYEIACNILGLTASERVESEFINMVKGERYVGDPVSYEPIQGFTVPPYGSIYNSPPSYSPPSYDSPPMEEEFNLTRGGSRWAVLERPYGDYPSMAAYIDSPEMVESPLLRNMNAMRASFAALATNTVAELDMMFRTTLDSCTHRLDIWRLSLVNQRINVLRGITNGSVARSKGIYLGAYGWVENVKKKEKTTDSAPTSNFSGTIYKESTNEGFIHAPSINQAITAAVLRSGYVNRAEANNESPLSVNLSSERIRAALEIMEGMRNGQELAVLLGYEFERRVHELYPIAYGMDQYIEPLRKKYTLSNDITVQNVTPSEVAAIKSRNVVNGIAIAKKYQEYYNPANDNGTSQVLSQANITSTMVPPASETFKSFKKEIEWISNLMDAIGDISTSEGMFHIVQGNPVKSGAITDAISKGNLMAEPDVIDTPKTGLPVTQRFTMHFSDPNAFAYDWVDASHRSYAEPYLNKWLGQLFGSGDRIRCTITVSGESGNTEFTFHLNELYIQPIDFLYLCNDNLENDDSILSLLIRKQFRELHSIAEEDTIAIDYTRTSITFSKPMTEVLPIVRYAKRLITSCRPLNTLDYVAPTESDGILKQYDLSAFYSRVAAAISSFNSSVTLLEYSYATAEAVPANTDSSAEHNGLQNALFDFSKFGIEQTVFEFPMHNTDERRNVLRENAVSVRKETNKRKEQLDALSFNDPNITPVAPEDEAAFIQTGTDILKIIFGNAFVVLPPFKMPAQAQNILTSLNTADGGVGSLLDDHNEYIVDEWLSSIAKVKKNSANYELLSAVSAAVDFENFTGNRKVTAFQLPLDLNNANERWLGASANNLNDPDFPKEGKVSYGISLPFDSNVDFTDEYHVGFMVDEWLDVIPNQQETTGVAFHHDQPNAKAPQCLILGLTPAITGHWQWADMVDMLNETFDLAKQRAVDYEAISNVSSATPLATAVAMPYSAQYSTIGLNLQQLIF